MAKAMISVEHIEQWRGQPVIDPVGEELGKLDEVFFDVATGTPVLVSIRSGLLGRRSKLVPVDNCTVGRDYVRVAHDRASIERAADSGREGGPSQQDLADLGAAYGLRFADGLELQSAGEMEARRAEAEAARRRAAELERDARDKLEHRNAATERAHGAAAEAEQAEREAEQARQAAQQARVQAEEYDPE